jgi:hypothetical protein
VLVVVEVAGLQRQGLAEQGAAVLEVQVEMEPLEL